LALSGGAFECCTGWHACCLPDSYAEQVPSTHYFQKLIDARWFNRCVLAAILGAAVLAGIETDRGLVSTYGPLLHALDRLVVAVFVVEMAIRLGAHGRAPWVFFRDGWNVFDFLVVLLSVLPAGTHFAAVLRLVRVLRLLRLITAVPKLRLLVSALLRSVTAMGYVGLLLGLMMYIYGVMGVHLFGRNDPLHFGSLYLALITLFRVITLENWSVIYDTQQYGSLNFGYEGREHLVVESEAQPVVATIYFISFILLGTMIMLNLFIGVIMNSMSEANSEVAGKPAREMAPASNLGAGILDHSSTLEQIRTLETQLANIASGISHLRLKLEGSQRARSAPPSTAESILTGSRSHDL
jgi:voltage-gated sodium channel